MILFFIFFVAAAVAACQYLFGKNKFSPVVLLLFVWFLAIGVAQLRLSPYEEKWSLFFWLVLALFLALFFLSARIFSRFWSKKIKPRVGEQISISGRWMVILTTLMTVVALAVNIYIYHKFGTLPILSTIPDRMRFIINKQVFGLWEYLALLPRLTIPLAFSYFLLIKNRSRQAKIIMAANIILGFLILTLYASRLVIVFAVLMSYFVYLGLNLKKINFKKIIAASALAVIAVLVVSIAIPVFRQYITYRDYYGDDGDFFNYIVDLSQIRLPQELRFLAPLYLIPSFNLQALYHATEFFSGTGTHYGAYMFSVFNPLLKILHVPVFSITIPWKEMFLPWWVTATFIFNFWVDGGIYGVIFAAIFWAATLSFVFIFLNKKAHWLSAFLFAYFSFVVMMSIYTNYSMRSEMYLDLLAIFLVYCILTKSG